MAELPFQEAAETAETRRVILGELDRLRALFVGSDTFDWGGVAYRVDRRRWLVLRASDQEDEDLLDFYGGEGRTLQAIDVVDLFSWLVSETLDRHGWLPAATHLLNLAVVQPLVNPACEPLFWVALNAVLDDAGAPADLMELLRPATFDMASYPDSRSEAPAVRAAQAELVRRWSPELLPADWASLDDDAWAHACRQLVAAARHGLETNVFALITSRAAAIRAGLRPR